jgi:hypothetical protein
MTEYRVTKYDPEKRNEDGSYGPVDWTSVSDIGRPFDGKILLESTYMTVEDAYVEAARRFLSAARVESLQVEGLEIPTRDSTIALPLSLEVNELRGRLSTGARVAGADLDHAIRLNLRELAWCRLTDARRFFIHFGYDYYMYIGCELPEGNCPDMPLGVFVELFKSPYRVQEAG